MRQTIQGEAPFQVLATNFSIGPSQEGYTLQISADGRNFSDLFTVPANTTRMVTSVANGSTYRLKGNNSAVVVNWERQCSDGGSGGGSGSGGTDPAMVQQMIDASLSSYSAGLEEGDPIVGMAKQLYSPDGVSSEGLFNYRTTAGDADVNTGDAELKVVGGNSVYPEITYDDSAVLERGGEEVTGFTYDIEWGNTEESVLTSFNGDIGVSGLTKVKIVNPWKGRNYKFRMFYNNNYYSDYNFTFNNDSAWTSTDAKVTQIDANTFSWEATTASTSMGGTAVWYPDDSTFVFTQLRGFDYSYLKQVDKNGGTASSDSLYYVTGVNIPNDIPNGESTYIYGISAWTPSLPQALQNMKVGGEDYVPEENDEITINRNLIKTGNAVHTAPTKFVALGLNSFNKEGDSVISTYTEDNGVYSVAIYAVTGLSDGYVIYDSASGITAAGIGSGRTAEIDSATTSLGEMVSIVYPTAEKPYILVTTTDIDGLCIHPRWSGYRDEDYEEYSESEIAIDYNSVCPLYAVGNTRNTWDIANAVGTIAVTREAYSAARIDELIAANKVLGTDFDFDENYIYVVAATATTVALTAVKNDYKDNDFSVEYFVDANGIIPIKAYAETWYMANLVDKLRNMEGLIYLDSLSGMGKTGAVYECDDHLWYWDENAGVVAEWTDSMSLGNNRGYGLIFSHIPSGQKILEYKYPYSGEWRYLTMSGDTLVVTETGGTIVASCAVGNTAEFPTSQYGNSYKLKVNYQKHWIGIYPTSYCDVQNVWDGKVSGAHWGIVDHSNYPWLIDNQADGMPVWNSKGQIISKARNNSAKSIQFNTNASQYSSTGKVTFLTDGTNNGPDRMFVPTAGGTAGQILQSNGDNAAPTFIDWIKVVKITSDAYEALQTKDPNTLYVIDDNV